LSPLGGDRRKGAGGPERSREPSRPFLLSGQSNPYADAGPAAIPVNQLKVRGTGASVDAVALAGPAAATAAPARSPAATPDGRTGCKTAGTDSASRVRSALRTPDGRSKKIRIPPLRADPRTPASYPRMGNRAPWRWLPWLRPRGDARRSDSGTAGSGPGVSPGRWPSSGTVGWLAFAATDVPPRNTRGYSTEPEDGWVGRISRTP
jgi:hypothetical protein